VSADLEPLPDPPRGPAFFKAAGLVALLLLALLGVLGRRRAPQPEPVAAVAIPVLPSAQLPAPPEPRPLRTSVVTARVERNQTLGQALGALPLPAGQARAIQEALAGQLPFRRMRPGDQLRLETLEDGSLHRFTYRQDTVNEWTVVPSGSALRATRRAVTLSTELARVEVEIRGSVWESLQRAGEDPGLAVVAADVLAWDVDFYQDVHPGDRLKLLVEKVYADGRLLRYGEVAAAEFVGSSTGRKRLFRYTDASGQTGYYDDNGNSARRGFLKLPLRYAHLTSGYGSRVHPVLGYVKAHQGVDYGAPTGTAVWAVGDGVVSQSGWAGGCGKAVTLRHRNGLDTMYCHLSAVSVRAGEHVAQKQLIGAVGRTGLATGPHLHFAVKRNGSYVNPASLKALPQETPLAPAQRADFTRKTATMRARLDGVPVA
jgi:murein DD-endopeptidase MepM/ murein hydrolase activator NlpD